MIQLPEGNFNFCIISGCIQSQEIALNKKGFILFSGVSVKVDVMNSLLK